MSICGTMAYVPPEVHTLAPNEVYDGKKFDIYSCGIILYQLLTGKLPFQDSNVTDRDNFYQKVFKFQREFTQASGLSRHAGRLFFQMVTRDPDERPEIDEIRESSWMEGDIASKHEL